MPELVASLKYDEEYAQTAHGILFRRKRGSFPTNKMRLLQNEVSSTVECGRMQNATSNAKKLRMLRGG